VATALLDLFSELCALPSPPGEERAVADRVLAELRSLGLEAEEDGTGAEIGSSAGNLLARLPASEERGGGTPIFLCAHLDTVPPTGAIEPVVDDGVVRNAAGTILGADNKSAVAVMLDAARRLREEGRPHAGVELLFTTKEEVGLQGAFAFDHTRLASRVGFVFDMASPIGEVILGAPTARALELRFRGRAAHSGMAPEEGRSAIAAAARAVADFRLGRIDEETTTNAGLIRGGTARNIVPEHCVVEAEVRSHDDRKVADLVQEMLETAGFAASLAGCTLESEVRETYRAYRFRPDDRPVRIAAGALARAGYQPSYAITGGAADANAFNAHGLECVNLANGMAQIHTADEHIAVADLEGMVEVTLGLVEAARDAA
jgi:tripeptide aminopeptidase